MDSLVPGHPPHIPSATQTAWNDPFLRNVPFIVAKGHSLQKNVQDTRIVNSVSVHPVLP